jgi:hypothetical protein
VSPSPSTPPRSEAEQIVLLTQQSVLPTKELEWSRLKIQALEERLRMEMIRKYGPKSETLNDAQLLLLELEPGVSAAEVEAESEREPLPPVSPLKAKSRTNGKHPGRQELPVSLPRVERVIACTDQGSRPTPTLSWISRPMRLRQWSTMRMQIVRQRYGCNRLRAK